MVIMLVENRNTGERFQVNTENSQKYQKGDKTN